MKNLQRFLASASLIALLGAGCGAPSAPSPTDDSPAMPGSGSVRGGSACGSEYYPLKEGSSITYMTRNGGSDIPFKISVLQHDATNIKLQYDITVRDTVAHINQELVCDANGAIRGKGYFDFAQAFLGLDIKYEVLESTGEIFPSDFRVGKEWNTGFKVKITSADTSPIARMMNGQVVTTSVNSKVIAEESVTVPAGTFTAMKVAQTTTIDQSIGGRAVHTVTNNNVWYVKGVGLVKTESTSAGSTFTMEAQTIQN